jgi:hypothetical protein
MDCEEIGGDWIRMAYLRVHFIFFEQPSREPLLLHELVSRASKMLVTPTVRHKQGLICMSSMSAVMRFSHPSRHFVLRSSKIYPSFSNNIDIQSRLCLEGERQVACHKTAVLQQQGRSWRTISTPHCSSLPQAAV